jgi:hypothetical protein
MGKVMNSATYNSFKKITCALLLFTLAPFVIKKAYSRISAEDISYRCAHCGEGFQETLLPPQVNRSNQVDIMFTDATENTPWVIIEVVIKTPSRQCTSVYFHPECYIASFPSLRTAQITCIKRLYLNSNDHQLHPLDGETVIV